MAKKNIVPSGKNKGRDITEMNHGEVHTLWASWNGSRRLRESDFFKVILSELGRWSQKKADAGRPSATSSRRMPFGKHQGQLVSGLPMGYVQWAAENIRGEIGQVLREELLRRLDPSSNVPPMEIPPKPKKSERAIPDDSGTHFPWSDGTGKVHMIPNDVQMEGTENEECPFDATEPEYSEPLGDLDREFRAMFC